MFEFDIPQRTSGMNVNNVLSSEDEMKKSKLSRVEHFPRMMELKIHIEFIAII